MNGPKMPIGQLVAMVTFNVCCQACGAEDTMVGTGRWDCPACGVPHEVEASLLRAELVHPFEPELRKPAVSVYGYARRLITVKRPMIVKLADA